MSVRRVVLRQGASSWVVVKAAGKRIVPANVVLLLLVGWLACTAVMALRPGARARRVPRRRRASRQARIERQASQEGITEVIEG